MTIAELEKMWEEFGDIPTNSDDEIESFISPYRTHINKDLDSILAFCPETLRQIKMKKNKFISLDNIVLI